MINIMKIMPTLVEEFYRNGGSIIVNSSSVRRIKPGTDAVCEIEILCKASSKVSTNEIENTIRKHFAQYSPRECNLIFSSFKTTEAEYYEYNTKWIIAITDEY